MLAQIYSLKGQKKIEDILKNGRKVQSENFGVFFRKREDLDIPKFAFVVSKKISRLAINRNRVKRAMSESVRRNIGIIPVGLDFVLLAKKSIVSKSTDEIMKEVQEFFINFKNNYK